MRRSTTVPIWSLLWALSVAACGGSSDGSGATTTPPKDTTPTPPVPTVPAAPTGLSATSTSASSVTLTWTRNSSNETGFQIERSSGSGSFNQIATTAAGATAYSDTALAASTTYNYRVRAVGSAGTSGYSNVASLTTPAGCPAPTSITQDIAITTTWTAGLPGCVHYHVSGSINVTGTLTIEQGTVISFAAGAGLTVTTGSLGVYGAPTSRVRFTGDQAARGYWKGLSFWTPNPSNELSYADISYAGGNGTTNAADVEVVAGAQLRISHTVLEQSAGVGLYLANTANLGVFTADSMRSNANAGIRLPDRLVGALDNTSGFADGNGVPYIDAYAWEVSNAQAWQVTTAPIHFSGQTNVSSDLVIAPGVSIQFGADAGMTVTTGSLFAAGTSTSRILFSPEKQQRGYWRGLSFSSNNPSNRLSYANVSYAGGGSDPNKANVSVASGGNLRLDNSILEQSAGAGLYAAGTATLPQFSANTFRNNADVGVRVPDQLVGSLDTGSDYATGNGAAFIDATAWGVSTVQTWRVTSIPIRFSGQTTISAGLTLVPGVTVLFRADANWWISSGSLTAIGTSASHIRFLGEQSTPGFWRGLMFSTGTAANELTYTEIAHGGASAGNRPAMIDITGGGTLRLTNSNIHDSAGWGLYVELNGAVTPTPVSSAGNVFANNALGASNVP